MANASGAMGKGTSRTLANEWTFGGDAHPDITKPMSVITAWLRFVDAGEVSIGALTQTWQLCYANTEEVVRTDPTHAWQGVTSAMTATILHLIQLHIKPIGPVYWKRGDVDDIKITPIKMELKNTGVLAMV